MIKVIVAGAGGRMGGRLISLITESRSLQLAGAIEKKGHPAIGRDAGEVAGADRQGIPITDDLTVLAEKADVLIEFTAPEATLGPHGNYGRSEEGNGYRDHRSFCRASL